MRPTSVLFISCFVIILIIVQTINGLSNDSSASNKKETQGIGEWWIMSSVPTASVISNVSEKCFQHSREFLTALKSRLPWAVKSKSIQASLFLLFINFDFFFRSVRIIREISGRLDLHWRKRPRSPRIGIVWRMSVSRIRSDRSSFPRTILHRLL